MKSTIQSYHFFFLFLFLSFNSFAQEWQKILPFEDYHHYWDGYFNEDGLIILAGQSGRVMKSTDGGQNWSITKNLTEEDLLHVHVIPDTDEKVVLIGSSSFLFKSIDGGDTWNEVMGVTFFELIDMDSFSKNVLLASDRNGTVLRSVDQGDTWATLPVDADEGSLRDFSMINENQGWTMTIKGEVYYTADSGMTWDSLSKTPSSSATQISFIDENIGFISCNNNHLFKTTDGGYTWTEQVVSGFTPRPVEMQVVNENEIYVITFYNSGVLYSNDGGATWTMKNASDHFIARFQALHVLEDGTIWMTGDYQTVTSSKDKGDTWTDLFPGLKSNKEFVEFVDNDFGIIAGTGEELLKTMNGGKTWNEVAKLDPRSEDAAIGKDGVLFISNIINGILKSEDQGTTWEYVLEEEGTYRALESSPDGTLFTIVGATDGNKIYRSVDNGKNWESKDNPMNLSLFELGIVSNELGFASKTSEMLKTTDGGDHWEFSNEVFDGNVRDWSFIDEQTGWLVTPISFYKTTDGGQTWDSLAASPDRFVAEILFKDEQIGWLVGGETRSGVIHQTQDGGKTWELVYKAPYVLYDIEYSDIEKGELIVVGAGGQVIYFGEELVATQNPMTSLNLSLYPNPGNDWIILDHEFEEATLKIYNALGQLIHNAKLDHQNSPKIDMSVFPSGKYFIQVQGAEEIWESVWVKGE